MTDKGGKRVLIIGNFLSHVRGSRSVCEDLAERLSVRGWSVITASRHKARVPRLVDMLSTAWRHRNSYAVAQVDVFSGLSFVWAEAVCSLLRRVGKPYVLTLHGGSLPDFAKRRPRRVERLLGSANIVTTPSVYLQNELRTIRADIRLVPNAVDLDGYTFLRRETPEPRLVWLRAFHETYNPALAPRVMALLRDDFPGIHLTMVGHDKGDGSLQRVRRVADELGVADRISFTGGVPKSEVPRRLHEADIFLNTTNVDSAPVSVVEAMATGLCVVSTNVGGIPFVVSDGDEGLLVPPEDPERMAAAVRRILREPHLARRLSENGRGKAMRFDWSIVLPQWESLLLDLANRQSSLPDEPEYSVLQPEYGL